MPQVPDLVPTVAPSAQGAPNISVNAPVEAFGGAVAHALSGLGTDVSQVGDKIWQRAVELQNLQNETSAKNADASYMTKAGLLHAKFSTLEGEQAAAQYPQYIKDLQDARMETRNSLSNPMAQKMYDSSSLSVMGRSIFNGAGHAATQTKVAASNASQARIDQASNWVGENPTDDVAAERQKRVIETETEAQGRLHGWSPEQIAATKETNVSTATAKRIVGLSRTDVFGAKKMFDIAKENGSLVPNDAAKVENTVTVQFRTQGSQFIADKVLAGRRAGEEDTKTLDEYVNDGLKAAKPYEKDDPLFPDFVRDRIQAKYNQQKNIERDSDNQNVLTIGKALMKANGEGMLPTTIEELKAIDPAVGDAWDNLGRTPQKQHAILTQLNNNAKGQHIPITPENLKMFHEFKGKAAMGDDDERASFLSEDFATNNKLALSQRNTLMNLQEQLKKQSASDPRVARAVKMLRSDMVAAGIDPKGGDSARKDYYGFVGALQDQLDEYGKEHPGKVPPMEDVRKIGAQLMQEQTYDHGWLWDSKAPMYQYPVPKDQADAIRNDPDWAKHGITPNDDMIARIYRRQKFNEFYKGSGTDKNPM